MDTGNNKLFTFLLTFVLGFSRICLIFKKIININKLVESFFRVFYCLSLEMSVSQYYLTIYNIHVYTELKLETFYVNISYKNIVVNIV